MTEKQELLLQLFREVDAICKKHNLRYVMAGGTLIGVLRNEGFIPWDDDLDIVSFNREDLAVLDDYFHDTNAETAYLLGRY